MTNEVLMWCGRFASNIVICYIMFDFLNRLFERRFKDFVYTIILILYILGYCIVNTVNDAFVNAFYGGAGILLISLICYRGFKFKEFGVVLFYLYLSIVDVITVIIFSFSFISIDIKQTLNSPVYVFGISKIGNIFVIVTFRIIINRLKKMKMDRLSIKQTAFLGFLAVFEISISTLFILNLLDDLFSKAFLLSLAVGFIVTDLYIMRMFEIIAKNNESDRRVALENQQSELMFRYNDELGKNYSRMRNQLHDIKNHLQVVVACLQDGNVMKANEYLHKLFNEIDKSGLKFVCNNLWLSYIINNKMVAAEEAGIEFNVKLQDTDLNFVDDFDITTIFGNLLDNAIEACKQFDNEKGRIDLYIGTYANEAIILLKNTSIGKPIKEKDYFISTKEGHSGIGLSSVKAAIKIYEGDIDMNWQDKEFVVKIMLNQPADHNQNCKTIENNCVIT